MAKSGAATMPLGLLIASALLSLVAVHTIAYAVSYGFGTDYAAALAATGHADYWTAAIALVVVGAVIAAVDTRTRTRSARPPEGAGLRSRLALFASVWSVLALVSLPGFVLLENVERVIALGETAGLAPVALLASAMVLGPAVLAITAIAIGAVAVVLVGRTEYESVLNRSYASLVATGVYDSDFRHSPWAVLFVADVMGPLLADRHRRPQLRILECGCGTGAWIEELAALAGDAPNPVRLYGFDLSPDMAAAAQARLVRAGVDATVRGGDVLDPAAYVFDGSDQFDLVMAYDVVQQLPGTLQQRAVDTMLGHVGPGGTLVIFDQDARSRYGRIMGAKKWLRRYLGLPLVPRHYIHARYPDLEAIRARAGQRGFRAQIRVEREARKRALIIEAPPVANIVPDGH